CAKGQETLYSYSLLFDSW
nr:immunoglobulin heavy chain junction region [Macaca mulatta]